MSNRPEDTIASEEAPVIASGTYKAIGGKASFFRSFNTDKLTVEFHVLVPDPIAPNGVRTVKLPAYYNVEKLGRHRLKVGKHSKYRRDWITVANRRPTRATPLSPTVFNGALVEVEVCTVRTNGEQDTLHEHARYSKVNRILALLAGGGPAR